MKITKAKALEIRFDDVKFSLSEEHLRILRAFAEHMQLSTNPH